MAPPASQQETPLQVLKKLFFTTLLMSTMPFVAYFVSKKYFFEDLLSFPDSTSSLLAVIPAVFTVNAIIALYVYMAWNSEPWSEDEIRIKKE